jgi:hypothetical protein
MGFQDGDLCSRLGIPQTRRFVSRRSSTSASWHHLVMRAFAAAAAEQRDALGLVQEIGEPVEHLAETEVGREIDALPVMPKSRNKPKQPSLF